MPGPARGCPAEGQEQHSACQTHTSPLGPGRGPRGGWGRREAGNTGSSPASRLQAGSKRPSAAAPDAGRTDLTFTMSAGVPTKPPVKPAAKGELGSGLLRPDGARAEGPSSSLTSHRTQEHFLVEGGRPLAALAQAVPRSLIDGKAGQGVRHLQERTSRCALLGTCLPRRRTQGSPGALGRPGGQRCAVPCRPRGTAALTCRHSEALSPLYSARKPSVRTTRSAIPIMRIFTSCCVCRWTWGRAWQCQRTSPAPTEPGPHGLGRNGWEPPWAAWRSRQGSSQGSSRCWPGELLSTHAGASLRRALAPGSPRPSSAWNLSGPSPEAQGWRRRRRRSAEAPAGRPSHMAAQLGWPQEHVLRQSRGAQPSKKSPGLHQRGGGPRST